MATDEDLAAAYHEAAHAVLAVGFEWIVLAGPVELGARGFGAAAVKFNRELMVGDFDPDVGRRSIIMVFLAGTCAEKRLKLEGKISLADSNINGAGELDWKAAAKQHELMTATSWEELNQEVETYINHKYVWAIIDEFAQVLLLRKTIPASEANTIITAIRAKYPAS